MLLETAIILALASSALEMAIMAKAPTVRKVATKWPLTGVAMSFSLSYLTGLAFGAAGLTVMVAGITSTVITAPYYMVASWWKKRKALNTSSLVVALPVAT